MESGGGTDCHSQCAHWLRNDVVFCKGGGVRRHTWVPPYITLFCRAGPVCPAVGAVGYRRRGEGTPPYGGLQEVRCAGRCGERTERCQWQRKRSERVAAVKISSVRRKAAQKFWAPQQGHRPLRNRIMGCVGEGLCPSHGRGITPPLRKRYKKCGGAGRPGGRPLRYYPRLFTAPLYFPLDNGQKIGII